MTTPRPPIQLMLDLPMPGRGEAPRPLAQEVEVATAIAEPERPAQTATLMEAICDPENIEAALRAVVRNKGAPGVDGITVRQLPGILKARWPEIEYQLLQGRYQPQPVRRVQIPKPAGGTRDLGIPTVIDRVIQQAVLQRLQPLWDPTFSEHSFGFRPGRSAQQAVAQAQAYVAEGHRFVVDIDLAKFFDRVNHDRLMARVAERIADRRLLRLIRSYLTGGVLNNGLFETSREGTPQGGPLSPLLSNLVLDELDRELERRGLRFVRYADDCNIYVRSERAGQRVMTSITRFITQQLKLKVNETKSAVARPQERKFLGFSFTGGTEVKRAIAPKALERFRKRIREITCRAKGVSIEATMAELVPYLRGWRGYFGFCETPEVLISLIRWVRLRLRAALWRQWKTPRRRRAALLELGVRPRLASNTADSGLGPWYLARAKALSVGLSNAYFESFGLPSFLDE